MTGGYGVVVACFDSVAGETWIPTHASFSFIFFQPCVQILIRTIKSRADID